MVAHETLTFASIIYESNIQLPSVTVLFLIIAELFIFYITIELIILTVGGWYNSFTVCVRIPTIHLFK